MRLFSFLLILFLPYFSPPSAHAAAGSANKSAVRKVPAPKAARPVIRLGAGFSYAQWTERMRLNQGAIESKGLVNSGGPGLTLDLNLIGSYWCLGVISTFATGKAASGGFAELEFADGTDRTWYGLIVNPFALYKINSRFLAGAGSVSRFTWINWEPADKSLKVEAESGLRHSPAIQLRYRPMRQIEIVQTFAYFGAQRPFWIFSALWNF